MRTNKLLALSLLAVVSLPTKQATGSTSTGKPWMRCVSLENGQGPASGSSSPGTEAIGLVFTPEPNNGNEISADVLLLGSEGQVIKQIGHAEILSQSANGSMVFQQGPDSPFPSVRKQVVWDTLLRGPYFWGLSGDLHPRSSCQVRSFPSFLVPWKFS